MPDDPAKIRLDVLPNSGKVEQLRTELPAADAKHLNARTPIDEALDNSLSPHQRALRDDVVAALRTVYDPELPVNIFDLGLIYNIDVASDGQVQVRMTLTTPGCPVAGTLPAEIQRKVQLVGGVTTATVELVWDPPWDKTRMSEAALLELGLI